MFMKIIINLGQKTIEIKLERKSISKISSSISISLLIMSAVYDVLKLTINMSFEIMLILSFILGIFIY